MLKGFPIAAVREPSPASRAGMKAGDYLFKINGSLFFDLLDYHYLTAGGTVAFLLHKENGRFVQVKLNKGYDEDPGLVFTSPVIGPLRRCRNRCIFCFIDQQPEGLRPSLYEKDDDYRLSFYHGNYITLTNMDKLELNRVLKRRLSPLYISIHATCAKTRRRMMGTVKAAGIMEQLKNLAAGGIKMHGQVVICPGWNDGKILKKTVADLAGLYPYLQTVALVPVGLTRHRQGLKPLRQITGEEAVALVQEYSYWQEKFLKKMGTPFVYLADELYLLSGAPLPSYEHYGAYEQLENGVGLGRLFYNELDLWKKKEKDVLCSRLRGRKLEISLVTGKGGAHFLQLFAAELERIPGLDVHLYVLPNLFWGETVTVAGLLTGADLLEGLKDKKLGEAVFVPAVMLKEGTDLFLDGYTVQELSSKLAVPLFPLRSLQALSGALFKKSLLEG